MVEFMKRACKWLRGKNSLNEEETNVNYKQLP